MSTNPPDVPFFYFQGRRFEALLGTRGPYAHAFGGPMRLRCVHKLRQTPILHMVLTLDLRDPRLGLSECALSTLPLVFPFRYDNGAITYSVGKAGEIRIVALEGSYADDWPYPNYPPRFPRLRFDLTEPIAATREDFEQDMVQGLRKDQREHFVAVVPPNEAYGFGLWRPDDHYGDIHVVFLLDAKKGTVEAYNCCD